MKNAHRKARKISRIPPSSGSEVALEPASDETPAADTAADPEAPTAQRLTMPVTTDGRIDVTRLREKTKSALRLALSDPALSVALGTPSLETSAISEEDAALVKTITDSAFMGVSAASVLIARRAGFRPEHAALLVWDADEKNSVAPLTGKIARKWLPMLDGKYRDECLLGYQVITILAMKIQLMREASAQSLQPKAEQAS